MVRKHQPLRPLFDSMDMSTDAFKKAQARDNLEKILALSSFSLTTEGTSRTGFVNLRQKVWNYICM